MTGPVSLYWTILYYILYEYVVLYGPAVRPCGIPGCPFYYPLHCINTTNSSSICIHGSYSYSGPVGEGVYIRAGVTAMDPVYYSC